LAVAAAALAVVRLVRNRRSRQRRSRIGWMLIPGLGLTLVATAVALVLLFTGPRMQQQPSLRGFESSRPAAAAGAVPVGGAGSWPAPDSLTRGDAAAGRVYYGYYCEFCHGARGDGSGPVGASFVPRPADLRVSPRLADPDSALIAAMLSGPGHALILGRDSLPVLEAIVAPGHRPGLAAYVRGLARTGPPAAVSPEQKPLPPPAGQQ
jgi:hypothetical protein